MTKRDRLGQPVEQHIHFADAVRCLLLVEQAGMTRHLPQPQQSFQHKHLRVLEPLLLDLITKLGPVVRGEPVVCGLLLRRQVDPDLLLGFCRELGQHLPLRAVQQ